MRSDQRPKVSAEDIAQLKLGLGRFLQRSVRQQDSAYEPSGGTMSVDLKKKAKKDKNNSSCDILKFIVLLFVVLHAFWCWVAFPMIADRIDYTIFAISKMMENDRLG